jgi:hypothetical protein
MKSCSPSLRCAVAGFSLVFLTPASGAGLIGLYRFGEANASLPAADSSGNGLNGTYEGSVTPGQPGPLTSGPDTNSAAFDGLTGDVFIPGDPRFDVGDMTIEFWVNLNGVDTTYGMPLSRGANNNPWNIQISPAAQTTDPRQISWIAGGGPNLTTPAIIQPGVWQHLAIVQSGRSASWFLNGQQVTYGTVNALPPPITNADIFIGRRGDGYFLNGAMDNVAIYNTALNQTQIQNDMAGGVSPGAPNLVAVWDFNEASTNNPAADSSGNGYNGTYNGGVALVPSFTNTFGNAAQFDGSSGYVAVPPNPAFVLEAITIEFWINVAGSSYANYGMPISRCAPGSGSNLPWTVQLNPTSSATNSRTLVWIASGGQLSATAALPPDSWHHVAITQTGNSATIYVDGQSAGSGTVPFLQNAVYIAKRADGYYFDGSLADVGIFNLALSQRQIQNDMSNGIPAAPVTPEIFIVQPPQSVAVQSNLVASFNVTALITGGNTNLFGYQWQKNGTNILGATNSLYTIPPALSTDNGAQFDCVVTYPGAPAVTSAAATLTILTPGLVALWKFDETSTASPAADSSGNGNVGTYETGTSLVPGKFGNAVALDGTNGFVDFPTSTNFDLTSLTLEFWMMFDGSDINYMMPVTRGVNNPWTVQMNPVTDPRAKRNVRWIVGNSQIDTLANISTSVWHHVAITQQGTSAAVFIDGILAAQGAVNTIPVPSTQDILVGKRSDGYNFSGVIDDVALFNSPLTQNQIANHMQNGASATLVPPAPLGGLLEPQSVTVQPGLTATFATAPYNLGLDATKLSYQWERNGTNIPGATASSYITPPAVPADDGAQFVCTVSYPGSPSASTIAATLSVRMPNLVALWRFDDNTNSTTAADSSGNGHNGTYMGNCPLVPGVFGTAVSLDASTSDFVDFPSSPAFDLQNLTLEFWMNFNGSDGTYMMPFTRGVNNPWTFQINPGSGTRSLNWITANGSISTGVTPNVWHHVAITQQGASAALYIDGNLAAQGTPGAVSVPSTQDIFVGKRPDGYPFSGLIDDAALFDLALTQPQIVDQMQHGASSNLVAAVPATLSIGRSGNTIQLSWPPYALGFHLQENSGLANPADWADVAGGTNSPVTLSISNSVRYYRLKK